MWNRRTSPGGRTRGAAAISTAGFSRARHFVMVGAASLPERRADVILLRAAAAAATGVATGVRTSARLRAVAVALHARPGHVRNLRRRDQRNDRQQKCESHLHRFALTSVMMLISKVAGCF